MSGLEIVGAISGIANLAAIVFQLSKTLYEVGGSLSSASSDIKDLARDLETFSEELHLLASLFDGDSNRYSVRINDLVTKIIGDCAVICNKITKILNKVQSGGLRAKLQWVFKEKEILRLLGRLRDLKLSLMGMLGMLGALKADHLMDAMGVVSPSLLVDVELERIALPDEESENHDEDEDIVSTPDQSQNSLCTSSSGMESSHQNQISIDGGDPETNTSYIQIRSLTEPTPGHTNPDYPIPSISTFSSLAGYNGLVQIPPATESKESFYSACTTISDSSSSQKNEDAYSIEQMVETHILTQHETLTKWRNDLIATTMEHYKVDHNTAKDLVASFPTPSFEHHTPFAHGGSTDIEEVDSIPKHHREGYARGGSTDTEEPHSIPKHHLSKSQLLHRLRDRGDTNQSEETQSSRKLSQIQLSSYQLTHLWWRAFNTLQASNNIDISEISHCWSRNRESCLLQAPLYLSAPPDEAICLNARLQFLGESQIEMPCEAPSEAVLQAHTQIRNVYEMIQKTLNFKFGSVVWCFFPEIVNFIRIYSLPEYQEIVVPQLAEVITLVARYNVLESVYQHWPNLTLAVEYENALLELCELVLVYLNHLKIFTSGSGSRSAGFDPLWLGFWVERIRESDAKCRTFVVKFGNGIEKSTKEVKCRMEDMGEHIVWSRDERLKNIDSMGLISEGKVAEC